jgi:hypothetical protein
MPKILKDAIERAEDKLAKAKEVLLTLEVEVTNAEDAVPNAGQLPDDLDPANLHAAMRDGSETLALAHEKVVWAKREVEKQRRRVDDARRALLEAWADHEHDRYEANDHEHRLHVQKRDKALAVVEELEGVKYVPERPRIPEGGVTGKIVRKIPVSEQLWREVQISRTREWTIREFLRTGKRPTSHQGVRMGQPLKAEERPAILYGPNAELPDDMPQHSPPIDPGKIRINAPVW